MHVGDKLRIVANPQHKRPIVAFCGEEDATIDLATSHSPLVSRRIRVTREEMNGVQIESLHLSRFDGVNITRVYRAGVTFFPYNSLRLQLGDALYCVGPTSWATRRSASSARTSTRSSSASPSASSSEASPSRCRRCPRRSSSAWPEARSSRRSF